MRLRNIPRAEGVLMAHPVVIKEEVIYRGKWGEEFGNKHPIHIEIGMGKGQFLLTLARQNPNVNYIGIERYSSVLLRAVEKYDELVEKGEQIANVRFVCMDAADVPEVFAPGEVERIYLNFSDPWPKARHARRRLTSREFLGRYAQILTQDGRVEFKTDNQDLFAFSLEEVKAAQWNLEAETWDLHGDEEMKAGNVMTEYEEKFSSQGNAICKMIATR